MTSYFTGRSPIRVGIAGLSAGGGWAARAHVPALAGLRRFELRALAASSEEKARAAGQRHGVRLTFGSAEALARCDEVDLVAVTVKAPRHREIVSAAIDAGKMVLCEWPLALDVAEAKELAALAAARGVASFVGLQARSAPPIRYLRDLLSQGYVGRTLSTTLVASGMNWGATFDPSRSYQLDRRNGTTMLTVPFAHSIDALTFVLGPFVGLQATTATLRPEVREVGTGRAARMTAEDQIAVTGVLEGGAVAAVHFRGGRSRGTEFRWEINGTDGDLAVVVADPPLLQIGEVKLFGARSTDAAMEELPVPPVYERVPGLTDPAARNVAHAYAQVSQDLDAGSSFAPTFDDAVHLHHLLHLVERAAATGQRQVIPGTSREEGPR